jgi:PadR family transcriptional regulator, regulatory protein PadR
VTDDLTANDLLVLIATARLGDDAYGVTIRKEIADCAGRRVSLAAVYAALDRFERRGLAEPWLSAPLPERGGRARRHYRLSAKGRDLVRREREIALRMWRDVPLVPGGGP